MEIIKYVWGWTPPNENSCDFAPWTCSLVSFLKLQKESEAYLSFFLVDTYASRPSDIALFICESPTNAHTLILGSHATSAAAVTAAAELSKVLEHPATTVVLVCRVCDCICTGT